MIQPPKLTQLVANYLSPDSDTSSIEDWLQQQSKPEVHSRLATPSPAPPPSSRSHELTSGHHHHQYHEVTSSSNSSDQKVPFDDHYSDGLFHEAHRDQTRHPDSLNPHHRRTTPVPACEELFFADFDLPQFDPSEIWVTLDDKALVVEGEHRALGRNHFECHEYFRKVPLPADIDTQALKCTLHRDGHLLIEAPLLHSIVEYTDSMEAEEASEAVKNIPPD